jgi:kynureninase
MTITRNTALTLDARDPLRHFRDRYHLPKDKIYLDGNSLGPMAKSVAARVTDAVNRQWAEDLITSWNRNNWFTLPRSMGNKIARLVGGGTDNVIVADTISINLFKLLTGALALRRDRKIILSDTGNFPSDLYVAQGLNEFLKDGHSLKTVAPEAVMDAITEDVAVVMVTEVDYRTARRHDMKAVIARAHAMGALVIWDLSHSVGAIPVDLLGDDTDFAVGCTYKYVNGGPGAQAFVFVHPRHHTTAMPALVGWWGHENPFAFDREWKAAEGLVRQQCGTQAILSLVALDAALDEWADVDMLAVEKKSHSLCQLFVDLVETSSSTYGLKLAGPRAMHSRGSHVSFHCDNGYAVMQALIAAGVVGDFRAPDLIRFGFAPLYNSHAEVFDAAAKLAQILEHRLWDTPEFTTRKKVT